MAETGYLPALRFRTLTTAYDPVVRWTTRESEFKPRLLDQAGLKAGQRVLDLGSGTGTLLLMAKERVPGIDAIGLDPDPDVLERAKAKAERQGIEVRFDQGLSYELPYEARSFDRVLSSLVFHHLTTEEKRQTIKEISRVLRPGGELHVADLGRPADLLMYAAAWPVRVFDGFERTKANLAGQLPALFASGGLSEVAETGRLRTLVGTLALYRATKR